MSFYVCKHKKDNRESVTLISSLLRNDFAKLFPLCSRQFSPNAQSTAAIFRFKDGGCVMMSAEWRDVPLCKQSIPHE